MLAHSPLATRQVTLPLPLTLTTRQVTLPLPLTLTLTTRQVTKVFRSLPVLMVWSLQHLLVQLGLLVMGLMLVMWTLDDEVWAKVKADR